MWWEFHRLMDLTPEELVDEDDPIGLLEPVGPVDEEREGQADLALPLPAAGLRPRARRRSTTRRASRPSPDDIPFTWDVGDVVAIDPAARTVDLQRGRRRAASARARAARPGSGPSDHQARLFELGEWVAEHGIDGAGPAPRRPGPAARAAAARRPGARRAARRGRRDRPRRGAAGSRLALDQTTLPIQGPPGSGKTYTGARMICTLLGGRASGSASRRPATRSSATCCTAVLDAADDRRASTSGRSRSGDADAGRSTIRASSARKDAERRRERGSTAGVRTSSAARPGSGRRRRWPSAVDVLFVDEAGQISLANVVAIAGATTASSCSAIRSSSTSRCRARTRRAPTVGPRPPPRRRTRRCRPTAGLFLETTWRLHPDLCAFTSEVFYDDRLEPEPHLARQRLDARRSRPRRHRPAAARRADRSGADNESPDEADAVADARAVARRGRRRPGSTQTGVAAADRLGRTS